MCAIFIPAKEFFQSTFFPFAPQFGAGSWWDGTDLAAQDVVMVTINYRLDVLGFLSTEDDVMPGNYGMLDQVRLTWRVGINTLE